jgi:hypothetical protein
VIKGDIMKISKLLGGLCLAVTTIFTAPGVSQASSILIDKGSYTYDGASNLDWLDLTATTNLQPRDVLAGAGGFIAAGWHYATLDDVMGLYQDAGLTLTQVSPHLWNFLTYGSAPDSRIEGLINLLGPLGPGVYRSWTSGAFQGNSDGLLYYAELGTYDTDSPDGNIGSSATIFNSTLALGSINAARDFDDGNFLIRDHTDVAVTPLPAALPMFAAATGLLGFVGWRRRQAPHQI